MQRRHDVIQTLISRACSCGGWVECVAGVTCIYIIALEAFTFTLVFTLFLMGATWSCTRPWAAAVLIVLSIFGLVS
jgi:hypothetical protein